MTSEEMYDMQTSEEKEMLCRAKKIYKETGFWFKYGALGVKEDKLWGLINSKGELICDFVFTYCPTFENGGYARVFLGRHKCGLIDYNGHVIIDFKYDNVFPFGEDGYARVEKGCHWGTLDRDGKEHIKPRMKFQQIKTFHDGIAPAKIDTKWGLIDTEGNHISAFKYQDIAEEKNGLFFAKVNKQTFVYLNRNGEVVEKQEPNNKQNECQELNKFNLAHCFIPWLINAISLSNESNMSLLAHHDFLKRCAIKENYQIKGFEWEELKIDIVQFKDSRSAIIYKFPKPECEYDAVFGAIIVTEEGYYYVTLDCCREHDNYLLAFTSSKEIIPLGVFDIEASESNFKYMLEHTLPFIMKGKPQYVFTIPEAYQELDSVPEDTDNCLTIAKQTQNANCIVQLYPIESDSLAYKVDKQLIIDGVYESLSEDEAVIEINEGITEKGYHYLFQITKIKQKPSGIIYHLLVKVLYGKVLLCVQASFEEANMTGERDTLIFELMRREGLVTVDKTGVKGWAYDPYDENSLRKFMMNLSEQSRFDEMFPHHPLTQCRNFLKYIIENQ